MRILLSLLSVLLGVSSAPACGFVHSSFISTAFVSSPLVTTAAVPVFTGAYLPSVAAAPTVVQQAPAFAAQPVACQASVQTQAAVVQPQVITQAVLAPPVVTAAVATPIITASVVAPIVSPVFAFSSPLFFAHQHVFQHGGFFRSGLAFPSHGHVIRSRTVIR